MSTRNRTLTARFVETAAPPKSGRVEYCDAALPGFRFRVTANGVRSFSLVYRDVDRVQRRLTWTWPGYPLTKARGAAQAALRAVAEGKRPATDKQIARAAVALPGTVDALCDAYVARYLEKQVRRWRAAQGEIDNHVRRHLGALRLAEIERGHVRAMLAAIEPAAPVAANRALQRTRALFRWAIDNDLAATDPTIGVKRPTKETPAARVLSDDELAAVWRATAGLAYPGREFARLLILTGQRRDDVRLMHWGELDLERGDWVIPAARYKSARAHLVPLTAATVELLAAIPCRDAGGFVLSPAGGAGAYGNVTRPKRVLDKASGVVDWTWHDLRRTLRTGLSRLGIRPDIAERVIGHSVGGRLGMTYDTHEYRAEKLTALEAWGRHLVELIDGRPANKVVKLRRG